MQIRTPISCRQLRSRSAPNGVGRHFPWCGYAASGRRIEGLQLLISLQAQGQEEAADDLFDQIIENYPDTDYAAMSREQRGY